MVLRCMAWHGRRVAAMCVEPPAACPLQNTRQQVWAANALKAQGWRFHTQARRRGLAGRMPFTCQL